MDSGFCSWDFDTQEVKGFQLEVGATSSRAAHRQQRTNSAGSTISKAR
ncbi:hypothetical protein A2U01_0110737, partial [Trifolium medium]|nr:hypothetical protein [Trifolium medium]